MTVRSFIKDKRVNENQIKTTVSLFIVIIFIDMVFI